MALAAAAVAASFAAVADDAHGLLQRMEHALATRNYQGIFVHEHDGQSETLRIVHRVEGDDFAERVVSLDGSGREVIRRDGELRAYFPDQRVVLVDSGPKGGLLLTDLQALDSAAGQMYRLSEETPTRISGREARVLAVEPQDDLRYGYRVWIDEASAMPLKTQLHTSTGRVIEQLVFTELTLPAHIADAALQPAVATRDYRWLRHGAPLAQPSAGRRHHLGCHRAATRFPSDRQFHPGAGRRPQGRHAPGLQRRPGVSLGIRRTESRLPGEPRRARAPTTVTNLGSSSALSTEVDGHPVTAIGEVPPDTVRAIAGSLRSSFAPSARPGTGPRR